VYHMKLKTIIAICATFLMLFASVAMAAYQKVADNTVPAYRNAELTQRTGNERVDKGDLVTVFEERDNAYFVRYPVKNGTKDRWVPKNIFNSAPRPAPTPTNNIVTIGDGWYRIQPMHDLRRSMDALGAYIGNGNNVHMWTTIDCDQQKFYLQNRGNGYFSLQSGYGSRLFVTADGGRDGANLYTSSWNGGNGQLFALVNAGNGAYHVMSKFGNNLNFDCVGGGKADGNNIGLWTKGDAGWHQWKFTRVNGPSSQNNTQTSFQQYQDTAKQTVPAYTNAGLSQRNGNERVDAGDRVTVLNKQGDAFYVDYPAGNSRKQRWVHKSIFEDAPAPSGKLLYPLKGRSISYSSSRTTNGQRCDYVAPSGTALYAPADGTVKFMQSYAVNYGKLASYANQILFTSSDNKYTVRCAHLNSFNGVSLKYSQSLKYPCSSSTYSCSTITLATRNVKRGELLGYTGMTGNASGPHLHIEVKENGRAVAPIDVFATW